MGHAVQISALALLIGTLLGALICLLRTRKNPMARGFAPVYIAVLRGTPVLFDALLDSTPQEIDRMAERIPKEYLDNVDLDETVTVQGKHFTLAGAGELYAKLQQMNEAKGGVVHKDLFSMILSLLFRINQQSVPCTGQTA